MINVYNIFGEDVMLKNQIFCVVIHKNSQKEEKLLNVKALITVDLESISA